ncbi:hypothetical protein HYU22_02580 [Candidatus Woesearchaeota archaeon]|nr:hypothetical protein [Candidatus Woesearchaeota archaeon]
MDRLLYIAKEGIRKAKNSLVLPLIAAIALNGCSDCYTHNKTTMKLNRPVDGHVASMQTLELEPEPEIKRPRETIIDLINETHALSSRGMPHDAYATAVPASCLDGHPEWTTNTSFLGMIERGMYFPSLRFTMKDVSTVNHGLGHLQHEGTEGEAIAQFNEVEQMLMGYPLFINDAHQPLDRVRWAAYANAYGLEAMIRRAVQEIQEGNDLSEYRRMDILLYSLLLEHDGDFSEVRRKIERLVENGEVEHEARQRIAQFRDWYAEVTQQGGDVMAEASLMAKRVSIIELQRVFGEEAAQLYLNAHTRLLNGGLAYEQFHEDSGQVSIYDGFRNEMVCEIADNAELESKRPCRSTSRICTMVNGENVEHLRLALCCMTADREGEEWTFRRTTADAEAFRYSRASGPVTLEGLEWKNVMLIEIKSRTELNEGRYCPDAVQ